MSFFRSVRFRLTCWYSAVLAVVLVTFGALIYGVVRYQSLHHHDDSLRAAGENVVSILGRQPDCATLTPDQIADLGRLDRLVLVHELAGHGQVFYRSPDFDTTLPEWSEAEFRQLLSRPESFQTVETPSGVLRVYSFRYASRAGRQGVVRVMDSPGNVREALATLRWTLLLVIPLCLIVAAAGGYWLAGRALGPVDAVTRLAQEIEATNLGRRLPPPRSDDELGRLVKTFNQMIDRLEASFESMRRFTADASHELRTPLAILRSAMEVALDRERSPEEYRRSLEESLEEVERMTRIVQDLLLLARADAGTLELRREPVRLDGLASGVIDEMKALAETRQVVLSLDTPGPVIIAGDERWLRQLLYNLLDNAIKYTVPTGRVRVTLEQRDGVAEISVSDTGPGIPESEQSHLFERFYRMDKARSREDGGAGLGLAIALWVARSHKGDIHVESRAGEGSTFRVFLPQGTSS
jgi:heavy metal sensor kinase